MPDEDILYWDGMGDQMFPEFWHCQSFTFVGFHFVVGIDSSDDKK